MPARGLLTTKQKASLSILAKKAWQHCGADKEMSASEWRHEQVKVSVGKDGLRFCTQNDFRFLRGHFNHILGEDGRAVNDLMESPEEAKRQAIYKLQNLCKEKNISWNYVQAIAKNKHGFFDLDRLTAQQIWHLYYSVKRNGKNQNEAPTNS